MAVDVVVVNYKTPDLLEAFCASYERNYFEGCELTVVDVDMDSPYPQQIAEKYDAAFIRHYSNVGFGLACNDGAYGGGNDVILFANADTELSSDLILCYDALVSRPDWGVLGPRQVNEFNQFKAGGIFGDPRSPYQRSWDEIDVGQCSDVRDDALSVSGSLYFIKRSIWVELTGCPSFQAQYPGILGAFLETTHYFEEMWCSMHARAHGHKVVFYGPAKMLHHWHAASPHGGWADMQFAASQAKYREMCARHDPPMECE